MKGSARTIDSSYGFSSGGPCELRSSGLTSRWIADSVQAGDLSHGVHTDPLGTAAILRALTKTS